MTEVTKFKIPSYGEDPSQEMIDFLHKCKQPWDGDDSGITIRVREGDDGFDLGVPGDYVVCNADGVYSIEKFKPLTEPELAVLGAMFARSNMGMPMPSAHEVMQYRKNAATEASIMAMVNMVCADFMETDEDFDTFLAEANGWQHSLKDKDFEYVFKTWPHMKTVWEESEKL